jgi:hypothetical protein
MERYIFLDPDGTCGVGLTVIVAAETGVTYAHQCAGLATETRAVEGFAVPLGDAEAARPILSFFKRFKGNPPRMDSPFGDVWTDALIGQLAGLVNAIPFWETHRSGDGDRRLFLALDADRLDQLTEAWIPVRTAYGPAVLVCDNSD